MHPPGLTEWRHRRLSLEECWTRSLFTLLSVCLLSSWSCFLGINGLNWQPRNHTELAHNGLKLRTRQTDLCTPKGRRPQVTLGTLLHADIVSSCLDSAAARPSRRHSIAPSEKVYNCHCGYTDAYSAHTHTHTLCTCVNALVS